MALAKHDQGLPK